MLISVCGGLEKLSLLLILQSYLLCLFSLLGIFLRLGGFGGLVDLCGLAG